MNDKSNAKRGNAGPAGQTRLALIHAAIYFFGEKGFDAASTREIAARAETNIASIAYHFGGKEGLRKACAEYIVKTVGAGLGPIASRPLPAGPEAREAGHAQLCLAVETMVRFIVASREAGEFVQFVLREVSRPSSALDILYSGLFEPVHRRLCALWELATGEVAESDEAKIAVFTMIGQVLYFRIARAAVLRRLGWEAIGPVEAEKVAATVRANLEAVLAARTGARR
jgi:AcrR family transcriptional regulator